MTKTLGQRLFQRLHAWDYAYLLPLLARLPLPLGYGLADLRAACNAAIRRDWRSIALGNAYVAEASAQAYRIMRSEVTEAELNRLLRRRYRTEGRDEFEAALIAARRIPQLSLQIQPPDFLRQCQQAQGLVLLTAHFDSFFLGIVLLGRLGLRVNVMTSSITHHPAVASAVSAHFERKYRGMERWANGGLALDREKGMRPFLRRLQQGECLVILADAPAETAQASLPIDFLGQPCQFTNGFLRLAQRANARLGAFVCRYQKPGQYALEGMLADQTDWPDQAQQIYSFLSDAIQRDPGLWWGADLLPALTRGAPPA